MIVDSPAIVAVLAEKPGSEPYLEILRAGPARMSAASFLEATIVLDARRDSRLSSRLDHFIDAVGIQIEPVSAAQSRIARQAYSRYGRGSGHSCTAEFRRLLLLRPPRRDR